MDIKMVIKNFATNENDQEIDDSDRSWGGGDELLEQIKGRTLKNWFPDSTIISIFHFSGVNRSQSSMWKCLPITLDWKHTFETDYCDCFSVPLAKLMDCTRFQPIVGVTLFSYRFGKEQLFSSHGRRTSTRAWRCGALFQQLISKYLSTQLGLGYLPTEGSTWSGY